MNILQIGSVGTDEGHSSAEPCQSARAFGSKVPTEGASGDRQACSADLVAAAELGDWLNDVLNGGDGHPLAAAGAGSRVCGAQAPLNRSRPPAVRNLRLGNCGHSVPESCPAKVVMMSNRMLHFHPR